MDKYNLRGVSATKEEVHAAIRHLDKGLYPGAFCKILPDMAAGDPAFCNILHADTAGTKTSLAYLYWRETDDLSVWQGIAQDAIVMNLDDMACVGCTDHFILSSTIGRNKNLVPGAVIEAVIGGTVEFIAKMTGLGINIELAGGETADVGDIVRTIDVGYTAFARIPRSSLVINNIQAGDVAVGWSSFGKSVYESGYNSGMGSNGLTSARHDVLDKSYAARFPESFDPNTPEQVVYCGSKKLIDPAGIPNENLNIGQLLLAPTRTYLPVIRRLLREHRPHIHGLIHCTGGGQTKVIKFLENKRVIKDNLFDIPPLFRLIQAESRSEWREMYQVFNMGHRMEVYLPESHAQAALDVAAEFGIDARIIGRVEEYAGARVTLRTPHGEFDYDA